MDDEVIDKAIVLSLAEPKELYRAVTTREVMDVCAFYADRLIPFFTSARG